FSANLKFVLVNTSLTCLEEVHQIAEASPRILIFILSMTNGSSVTDQLTGSTYQVQNGQVMVDVQGEGGAYRTLLANARNTRMVQYQEKVGEESIRKEQ